MVCRSRAPLVSMDPPQTSTLNRLPGEKKAAHEERPNVFWKFTTCKFTPKN